MEATSPDVAMVRFEVTAQDNVDGTTTLDERIGSYKIMTLVAELLFHVTHLLVLSFQWIVQKWSV